MQHRQAAKRVCVCGNERAEELPRTKEPTADKRQTPTATGAGRFRLITNFFVMFACPTTDNQRVPSGAAVAVKWRTGRLRVHQRPAQGGRHSAGVSQGQSQPSQRQQVIFAD